MTIFYRSMTFLLRLFTNRNKTLLGLPIDTYTLEFLDS